MIDLKANFLLSAVALMTAALGIVASQALEVSVDAGLGIALKAVGLVSFLAYVVLAMVPALALYAVAERQLIGGLTSGASKG